MRTLLALVLALLCSTAEAAIFQNSFTTNSAGKTPNVLATSTNLIYPLMVLNPDGSGVDRAILYSPYLYLLGSNLFVNGAVVGNGGGGATTNYYSSVVITNLYVQNGSHNTMIITNSLTLQSVKTNVLATTATGLVTNVNYGTGLTWTPSTLTLSASGGGDTTGTNIVTLTQTGTNISQMDFALLQFGGAFKLTLTGNAYVGSPANVVNTSFKKAWLIVQQPSTGTCLLQFTNGVAGFAWPQGVAPVMDTNNSSVAVFEFVTDVFTNGLVHGSMSSLSKTATNL